MARGSILVIEDDRDIVDLLRFNLEEEGYELFAAFDGARGGVSARRHQPDLIILDIMMPELDGWEVCRKLKEDKHTADIPIIILSARLQEMDKVVGLELGADDYVTKPFSPRELIARIRAILRRNRNRQTPDKIAHGSLVIDRGKHEVVIDHQKISLTTTEFRLLEYMAQSPGQVLSRDQILNAIAGYDAVVSDRTVDAHIKTLRRKLGKDKDYIETVRGVGYRFKEV